MRGLEEANEAPKNSWSWLSSDWPLRTSVRMFFEQLTKNTCIITNSWIKSTVKHQINIRMGSMRKLALKFCQTSICTNLSQIPKHSLFIFLVQDVILLFSERIPVNLTSAGNRENPDIEGVLEIFESLPIYASWASWKRHQLLCTVHSLQTLCESSSCYAGTVPLTTSLIDLKSTLTVFQSSQMQIADKQMVNYISKLNLKS